MLTQCPQCNTTYRLQLEQLSAAEGKVRCSRCRTIFDALDHLAEAAPTSTESPEPSRSPSHGETALDALIDELTSSTSEEAAVSSAHDTPPPPSGDVSLKTELISAAIESIEGESVVPPPAAQGEKTAAPHRASTESPSEWDLWFGNTATGHEIDLSDIDEEMTLPLVEPPLDHSVQDSAMHREEPMRFSPPPGRRESSPQPPHATPTPTHIEPKTTVRDEIKIAPAATATDEKVQPPAQEKQEGRPSAPPSPPAPTRDTTAAPSAEIVAAAATRQAIRPEAKSAARVWKKQQPPVAASASTPLATRRAAPRSTTTARGTPDTGKGSKSGTGKAVTPSIDTSKAKAPPSPQRRAEYQRRVDVPSPPRRQDAGQQLDLYDDHAATPPPPTEVKATQAATPSTPAQKPRAKKPPVSAGKPAQGDSAAATPGRGKKRPSPPPAKAERADTTLQAATVAADTRSMKDEEIAATTQTQVTEDAASPPPHTSSPATDFTQTVATKGGGLVDGVHTPAEEKSATETPPAAPATPPMERDGVITQTPAITTDDTPAVGEGGGKSGPTYAIPLELSQQKGARGTSAMVWGFGILLLSATLILQYLYHQRLQLANNPQLRPLLLTLCAIAECELPPRRDPRQIELSERLMQFHPNYEQSLLITATISNQADFDQPYPLVEVIMTGIEQQVVARRHFLPRQYLPGDLPPSSLFAANSEIPLMLEVLDPGNEAVGFEFRFH